jgi:cell division protein FtsB
MLRNRVEAGDGLLAMSFARVVKRRVAPWMWPLLFASLAGYFMWSATQGARGLNAFELREQDLAAAQAQLDRANAELGIWERRVSGLRADQLDRDALDERVRAMLNLSDPADVVVPYGEGKRLY